MMDVTPSSAARPAWGWRRCWAFPSALVSLCLWCLPTRRLPSADPTVLGLGSWLEFGSTRLVLFYVYFYMVVVTMIGCDWEHRSSELHG